MQNYIKEATAMRAATDNVVRERRDEQVSNAQKEVYNAIWEAARNGQYNTVYELNYPEEFYSDGNFAYDVMEPYALNRYECSIIEEDDKHAKLYFDWTFGAMKRRQHRRKNIVKNIDEDGWYIDNYWETSV